MSSSRASVTRWTASCPDAPGGRWPSGRTTAACLRLINDLEVNEQALYARMENVAESTLE